MTKVLVTGASGFIGQALCTELARRNYDILAAVRSAAKYEFLPGAAIPFIGDVEKSHPDTWRDTLRNVDTLIHLAACVHQRGNPIDQTYRRINTRGTSRLCRLAIECGVGRFIFLSTIKVNGETSNDPLSEKHAVNPQGPYALSKWQAEKEIQRIRRGKDTEFVIIRPPLVYGPNVKANFLSLLKLASANLPLPVGSLHNRRSLIYVGNLVDALICAMESPQAAGQVFMVSDGQDLSVANLFRAIAKAMDHNPRLFPFPPGVLYRLLKMVGRGEVVDKLRQPLTVDISKIRRTLGWQPPFSFSQGLADTVDWFCKNNRSR